jgi:hypothetical protein
VGLFTDPALGLFNEPVLEVVNPDRAERAFAEVEDLVAFRLALAGDGVHLVITVQVVLIGPVAEGHASHPRQSSHCHLASLRSARWQLCKH